MDTHTHTAQELTSVEKPKQNKTDPTMCLLSVIVIMQNIQLYSKNRRDRMIRH